MPKGGVKRKHDGGDATDAKKKKSEEAENGPKDLASNDPKDVASLDFSSSAKTKSGKEWNKKFASMNVNGFRAFLKKGGMEYIKKEDAEVLCIQETKCPVKDIPNAELEKAGFKSYFLSGDKDGYSGVGIIYKNEPISIKDGIDVEEHDKEGRVITAEYDDYYLVTAYVPNSARGLKRLDYRTKEWDEAFRNYLLTLKKNKPVILCGDMNVAHNEIDLKNPKPNKNKTPGFCDGEREGMTTLLKEGFTDTFRHLYPDKEGAYTFWSYMGNARGKNVGWRLDYFITSEKLEENICDVVHRTDVMGSDHCPVVIYMNL